MDQHVADIEFADGVWREAWERPDGRKYVVDADGQRVYGVWFIPPDPQPCIVVDRPI